jgi:hypothetical protein
VPRSSSVSAEAALEAATKNAKGMESNMCQIWDFPLVP